MKNVLINYKTANIFLRVGNRNKISKKSHSKINFLVVQEIVYKFGSVTDISVTKGGGGTYPTPLILLNMALYYEIIMYIYYVFIIIIIVLLTPNWRIRP